MEEIDKQSDEEIECTSDETTECQEMTSKLNMKNVKKVYAKDSMDRLGHDFTEEVIQYTQFHLRLEYVKWNKVLNRMSMLAYLNG